MRMCRECGTKIGESDQYCTGCGARVYRGEECESYIYDEVEEELAPGLEAEVKVVKKINVNRGKINGLLSDTFGFILDVYSRPVVSSGKYGKKPVKEASILISFTMAAILGLISLWANKKAGGVFSVEIVKAFKFGVVGSYIKIFGASFMTYLLLLISLSFGLFVSGQLMYNVRSKFLGLWNIAYVAGVLYTTAALLAVLLSYLFPSLILIFVVFIGLISAISVYQGIKDLMNLSEDRAALAMGVGVTIMMAMVYLVGKI